MVQFIDSLEEPAQTLYRRKKTSAYIFDLDGTVIDSDVLLLNAWKHGLHRLGKKIEDQEIMKYFGMCTEDIARLLLVDDTRNIDNLMKYRDEYFDANWKDLVEPMPGSADVLSYLNESGFGIAVSSSNPNERIRMILKRFRLDEYVDVIIGRDDVEKGKPDPDLVTEAAKRLGVPTANCTYVGDSVYDVIAGRRAGSRTVFFVSRPIRIESLEVRPDRVVYALVDLKQIV